MFKAVLFDLSGTLLRIEKADEEKASKVCCGFLQEGGFDVSASHYLKALQQAFADYDRRRTRELVEIDEVGFYYQYFYPTLQVKGVSVDMTRKLIESWMRLAVVVRIQPGVKELIGYLRDSEKKVGVVSDILGHLYRVKLSELGILDLFDTVCISSEVGIRKPSKPVFLHALRQLGVDDPAEVLFVGNDPVSDIEGARNVGMGTVFLRSVHHPECSQADFSVENFHELLEMFRGGQLERDFSKIREGKGFLHAIEKTLVAALTDRVGDGLQAILFFGSIVGNKLREGSDIDVILVTEETVAFETIQSIGGFQRDFNKASQHALSLHIFDKATLGYWRKGRNILRFLTLLRRSRLIYGTIADLPDIPSREAVIDAFKQEAWEIRRLLLYNISNLDPSGRIFTSKDLDELGGGQISGRFLQWFLLRHHVKMVKQFLASLEAASHIVVVTELKSEVSRGLEEIKVGDGFKESRDYVGDLGKLYNLIEKMYQHVCCGSFEP